MQEFLSRILGASPSPNLICHAPGLLLRPPEAHDYRAWADLRERSRGFLQPWEPVWPENDLSLTAFSQRLRRIERERRADQTLAFHIFDGGKTLLGGITFSNIRRRAAMSATLGYWMGAQYAGKGVMSRAVPALCRHAFLHFGFERIEAACLPENAASIRVLEKAGFVREGYARRYLSIAGQRRDHLLFALLPEDLSPSNAL
ncbi:MAG: GNAT family N-acetyltransferase [Proteobacteria bacterium]|nr:GNAT family N-acetyltransferase [Pseudomonadota bacterium]